ncbi:MAG: DUF6282 family protein [Deltaproteobacteria bacterium]|nr:DUF6282 family protein [Deltaproteobacteria bacterium]
MKVRMDVELLRGACDLHTHTGPALFDRLVDDFEAAKQARDAGMKAIVLKDHHCDTSRRAYLTKKVVSDIEVFGSLVLNYCAGGLNPFAVDVAIKSGAKIIFMPTVDAQNHEAFYGELGQYGPMKLAAGKGKEYESVTGISLFTGGNTLDPCVPVILKLIAEANVILATSHLSSSEVRVLIAEARKAGVKKIVVTHVDFDFVKRTIDEQIEWANQGAYMEYVYSSLSPAWHSITIEEMVENIQKVRPERCILSSDLGQMHNPVPVEGLRILYMLLLEKGFTEEEIGVMCRKNPAKLLGLD